MADISIYLAKILSAVYGEEVRGSIHDAIDIINQVSEVVLTTGTAVTSSSSSSEGFFVDSLYLNTDTYELWKCAGTDSWASQGVIKGADGEDGAPGTPGADGNKWYRGTGISGKAVNPTVYSGSGITNANPNDFYLNPSEGAVYHCVTGGDASTATWAYDFTMTGGGGGSTVIWTQIQTSTGATKIAEISIDGSKQDVYAPSGGGGGSSTFAGLNDTDIDNPQADQIVQYKSVGGNLKLQNVNMPQGGHDMIPVVNDIATLSALTDGDDDYVINAYTAKRWSNVDAITLYTTLQAGTDTIGAWNDNWKEETPPDRSGWIWHTALLGILSDNDIDFQIVFDPSDEEAVSLYAYRVDDNYTPTGETEAGGCVAIKFNNAPSTDITVGILLSRKRTTAIPVTPLT